NFDYRSPKDIRIMADRKTSRSNTEGRRRFESAVEVFQLLAKPLLAAEQQATTSGSTRPRRPDFPLLVWLPETLILGLDLPEGSPEEEKNTPLLHQTAVWLFTDRTGRLRATRRFTDKEVLARFTNASVKSDTPCCLQLRDL
ncbi:hypothetical protein FOZ62_015216, partial [Perkinsus olseni]